MIIPWLTYPGPDSRQMLLDCSRVVDYDKYPEQVRYLLITLNLDQSRLLSM
jgi:hypothetical protein